MVKKTVNFETIENEFDLNKKNHRYIIGFLDEWVTLKELVVKGLNYSAESSNGDFNNTTRVVCQNDDITIVCSELYYTDENNETLLDMEQKVIIHHKNRLDSIKKEYNYDLMLFNHIKNMMVDNYNYTVIVEEEDYDEFGLDYDIENVKIRKLELLKQYPTNITVDEFNKQFNEVSHYLEESVKEIDCIHLGKYQFFNNKQIPCCKFEIVQKIK